MSRPSKRRETPISPKVSIQRLILSRPSSSIPAPRKSPKIPIQKLILSRKSRPWSDLTVLVLERIRDLLDSTIYDIRLRSVCSNWRTSLARPRQNRSPNFPIKLPALPEKPKRDGGSTNPVMPKYSCIYRVSSVDAPSHGWLFRSLDTTPNTFPLLHLFHIKRMICPPNTVPKSLNLLQVRISEVCKSYWLDGVGSYELRKVLLLPNFVKNVAFTVLVVLRSGNMYYCNDGDLVWTAVGGIEDYKLHDLIIFNGIYYVVSDQGCLFSLDSGFRLKEVAPAPPLDLIQNRNNVANHRLLSLESDLLLVSVLFETDFSTKTELRIFKWTLNGWYRITDLSDTILLWCSGVSVGFSAKDFEGCKGNCVYFTHYLSSRSYKDEFSGNGVTVSSMDYQLYDLDVGETLNHRRLCRRPKMFWPPPKWMQPT